MAALGFGCLPPACPFLLIQSVLPQVPGPQCSGLSTLLLASSPSLQATFVPAKWGDLPSLSTAAPFPGQLCRDTRSPPAPDLPRPLRTSVVPLCPCLNPESNVPSIFPCASFISTAQLLRQVIHPVKARTGCSLLFYQTRRVTCMSSVSVS